ncbi:hypothetical protein BH10PAT3_BH10PAT3_2660 [soil metagenome]
MKKAKARYNNPSMSFNKFSRPIFVLASMAFLVLLPRAMAFAQTSSSTNYKTNEYYFGNGGEVDLNSTSYKARGSAGGLGVGDTSSTNYKGQAGFVTPQEEFLEMSVTGSTVALGNLTTGSANTATGAFYIRAYTSSGYYVTTVSGTPGFGAVSLAPMTVTAASAPGTEQFGINLVANTSPASFGANPAPQPNSGYAYGAAATGYATTNQYKYNAGDTIATSPKGIGQTNFTISYIANISVISKAGLYSVNQILVVVAGF